MGEKVRFPFSGSLYSDFENDQFRHFMSRHGPMSHSVNCSRPKSREMSHRSKQERIEENKKTEFKMEELRKKMKNKNTKNTLTSLPPIKNTPVRV